MGQYLSSPVTDKESAEGYNDTLGFGLSAMQGWRVSMEDAHITALDLDPQTRTSLFSVFDGHGGKAVAKFCAKHLAAELLKTESYRRGDLRQAMADAYYALDLLLDSEEGKQELRMLVGAPSKSRSPAALFSGVEENLQGDSGSEGRPSADGPAAETQPLAAPGGTRELKKSPSEQFVQSHLMRASVLSPATSAATAIGGRAPENGEAAAAGAGAEPPQGPGGGGDDSGGTGRGEDEAGSEEGEEEHHAAGMGCTAASVLVRGDYVLVANTGDSRCVLSRKGQAIALTLDHKPILFEEARRIIKAGGFVRDNRINGALNVSRTIGDLDFKRNADLPASEQMVVATPDLESFTLREGDEFIVLACDGIWDVMSNQEAVDFVRKRLKGGMRLQAICEAMCDACLAPDLKGLCRGADNMSVIVVLFRKHANLGGWWSRLVSSMCNFSSSSAHATRKHHR